MPRKLRINPSSYQADGTAHALLNYMRGVGASIPTPVEEVTGTPVYARADHGRWIVECDVEKNAQYTDDNDQRFFCISCFNVAVDGKWRQVIWPEEVNDIESALAIRPIDHQNWTTGETVESLEADNIAKGLPANDE